jgi:hypothetical protein
MNCILYIVLQPKPSVWLILIYFGWFEFFGYIEIIMIFRGMNMICDFSVNISWRLKFCILFKKWYARLSMFYKKKHVLKHDSWYEMYCFKAGGIIIWIINRTSEWGI